MNESSAPPPVSEHTKAVGGAPAPRGRDRLYGMLIVALAFVLCLALSLWAKERSHLEEGELPGPPTVQGIKGWPANVNATRSLNGARVLTRRQQLRGIVMDGVGNDGTLDFSEGPSHVRYVFQSPAHTSLLEAANPKRMTCGLQRITMRREGLVAEPDSPEHPCPTQEVAPLPVPGCSARDIWRIAKRRKVPRDRLAHIEYYRAQAGPAWRFELLGTPHRFSVLGDCKTEVEGAQAAGVVP